MTTVQAAAPRPQPTIARKVIGVMRIIVVATILGPLIAGVSIFMVGAIVVLVQGGLGAAGLGGIVASLPELLVEMVGAAYIGGGIIAFVAGAIVGMWTLMRQPTIVVVVGAVVAANLLFYILYEPGAFMSDGGASIASIFMSTVISIYAAVVCWFAGRRFVIDQRGLAG